MPSPSIQAVRQEHSVAMVNVPSQCFLRIENLISSAQLLVHFDSDLPLLLACDASAYGVGAVLAHQLPDGSEKPLGYASRTVI